jgi:hypothetical protein
MIVLVFGEVNFFSHTVQTESEVEVKSLLDDLGLREKQQFVRLIVLNFIS